MWEDPHISTVAGVTKRRAVDRYRARPVRNQAAQQEVSLNIMHLNHPETILPTPGLWENCVPQNQSLVLERLGTAA